jgi:GrpB-like predicted nucleotidyltransferase (UPF0157 family)/GNAT superfamily N-acetyltransferase
MTEQKKIQVVPYDPRWPELFRAEADQIQSALGSNCLAVHHVGSTSVPQLCAKPKIDIIVVVKRPEEIIKPLETIGYEYRGEFNIPLHYGFRKRGEPSVNLHVYEEGNPEIELNLTFRNYLRNHPDVRDAYGELKQGLLGKASSFVKENSMFTGYNLGKNSFICKVLELAGWNRLRFVHCTHFDEWEAAKKLRKENFFPQRPDPYEWTFQHKDHVHFVLYKGIEVIGYAHVQLWPDARAALRIIVIEKNRRKQGNASQFLKWIEAWLASKKIKSLHTEASPSSLKFYESAGYTRMPFEDPDGYEGDLKDTAMGKELG